MDVLSKKPRERPAWGPDASDLYVKVRYRQVALLMPGHFSEHVVVSTMSQEGYFKFLGSEVATGKVKLLEAEQVRDT